MIIGVPVASIIKLLATKLLDRKTAKKNAELQAAADPAAPETVDLQPEPDGTEPDDTEPDDTEPDDTKPEGGDEQ